MRRKVILGFAAITVLLWAICLHTIFNSMSAGETFADLESDIIPDAVAMSKMKYDAGEIRNWTLTYILRGNAIRDGKPIKEWLLQKWASLETEAREHLEGGPDVIPEEHQTAEKIVELSQKLISVSREIVEFKDKGIDNDELFEKVRQEFGAPVFYPLSGLLDKHSAAYFEELKAAEANVHREYKAAVMRTIMLGLLTTFLALLIAFFVDRRFTEYLTDRKRMEEAVRTERDKAQGYLNIAGVMLATINADETITLINKSGCQYLGYTEGELLGKNWFDTLVPEKIRDEVRGVFNSLMAGEIEPVEFYENPLLTKDGDERLIAFHNTVTQDQDGHIDGVLLSAEDITERKKAEQKLTETYRIISRSPAVAFLWKNEEHWPVEFVTNNVEHLSGYTAEEFRTGMIAYDKIIHPDDLDRVAGEVERGSSEEGREGFSHEPYRIITKDGKVRWVSDVTEIRRSKEGGITHYQGIVVDITDLKKAEEALRESEERFRAVFETAQDCIFIKDLNRIYTSVNPAMERMFGLSAPQLVGLTDEDLFGEEAAARIKETDKRVLNGKVVKTQDTNPVCGEPRTFHVIKVPMRDANGEITGLCGIARDVTEKQKLEEELAKVDKLESVGLLAGGIAHDFNNLLTGILGNISLAMLDMDPDNQAISVLFEAERATTQARNLTRQLLTFSKGGAPVKKTASLTEIIRDSSEFALRGSNVRCEFSLTDDLYPVEADEGQISQVIHNLIINADQAMPQGGVISVRAENTEVGVDDPVPLKPGKYIRIMIEDHGVGIPQEYLNKIFDPFFSTKKKGTGLGLATTYSIIRNHGGHIEVESESGSGTTFRIYLPASEKEYVVEEKAEERAPSGCGRILVMDDEDTVRIVTGKALGLFGYETDLATNGQEAVELYQKAQADGKPYDAVILDLTVPGGMGGEETLEKLRKMDPHIRAIVTSGYSDDPVMAHPEAFGFSGVVTKPYTSNDLGRAMHELLNPATTPVS